MEGPLSASLADPDEPDAPASERPGMAGDQVVLEFVLEGAAATRLARLPAVAAVRAGPARTVATTLIWHDTPCFTLAKAGLALCEASGRQGGWTVAALHRGAAADWLPAHAAPVLAAAPTHMGLARAPPDEAAPVAAFAGRLTVLPLRLPGGPGQLSVLSGACRGLAHDVPACRIGLTGPVADAAALAAALAATLPLHVPLHSLAAEALALARGGPALRQPAGKAALAPGTSTEVALRAVIAQLADTILYWATQLPDAASPEPVHQMRVAVRRLRSALTVFRRAVQANDGSCLWLDATAADLRALAGRLGAARDWDVFLGETGQELAAALPEDRQIGLLLAAAGRKRAAAYGDLGAYFAGQSWTQLALHLALIPTLQPWRSAGEPAALAQPARDYAMRALDRRLKQVLAPGGSLAGLATAELHEVRKQAKRLRYATEFFAPLFAGRRLRRFLLRLARLQAALGSVNDAAAAAGLAGQLPGSAFAAGVVHGFGAARAGRARSKAERAWERFVAAEPFWD